MPRGRIRRAPEGAPPAATIDPHSTHLVYALPMGRFHDLQKKWAARYPALGLVGHTPLVRVDLFREELPDVEVYAKIESFNPGGSLKDRPVLGMILEAL